MNNQSASTTSEAIFNIGAVARMTGIPIASLHAWERRYGFPHASGRTPGGHRLYSEKDVALLRSVKAQIEQGLSAHLAVAAVQKMDREGRLPAEHPVDLPRIASLPASPAGHAQLSEALSRHDLGRADQLLGEMLAFSSPEEITLHVIGPLLAELGEAWETGRITRLGGTPGQQLPAPAPVDVAGKRSAARAVRPVVLACAPGEWHEGSLLMLGVLLRRRGWPVAYLGQNVPLADLAHFMEQTQAQALVLVGMLEENVSRLAEWSQWIKPAAGGPLVTFAGRPFVLHPELIQQMPGIYLGDTVQEGLAHLERLLMELGTF